MPVIVGLKDLYYAIQTKDDSTGVAYSAPIKIAGLINAKITPSSESLTVYADDGPSEQINQLGTIGLELETKDLPLDVQAALLGHSIVGGVLIKKDTDIPPYVAIGYRSSKSNGKYRYMWLLKGKFDLPGQEDKTKEDKPSVQTPKIAGTFMKRDYDGQWQRVTDEDLSSYVPATGANWFTSVEQILDTTPPTVTIVPANNATAVAVGSSVVWTFNEPILASTVNKGNFLVQKADGSAQVAGTLVLDATLMIVTFTPSTNLTAATQYMAIATQGVQDVSGNALASPSVTKFTTA
ncbi:major tail protein [Bacillus sp. ISL-7]|uniref:major tail protein n=1 Tax=Bacillus sp. ISL-7 TaxID=2819136 RepID=UPI0020351B55|nr:major tail protein [Bacillus sp. ISL-7]